MSRENTNLILTLIDDGVIDPKKFLESLLQALEATSLLAELELYFKAGN